MACERDWDTGVGPVQTTRVSGRVRTLIEPCGALETALGPVHETDSVFTIPIPALGSAAFGVIVALVLVVVTSDVHLGALAGTSVVAAIVIRRLAQRVTFSFGEGFLPYRSDLGWPRGVQEDDDVHWAWADGRRT